jgi:hypothetical protein
MVRPCLCRAAMGALFLPSPAAQVAGSGSGCSAGVLPLSISQTVGRDLVDDASAEGGAPRVVVKRADGPPPRPPLVDEELDHLAWGETQRGRPRAPPPAERFPGLDWPLM